MDQRKLYRNVDKHSWHPSVLPGQIVLVTTVDVDLRPNLAPKSWVTMVAFDGPLLCFGCSLKHTTYQNIVATGDFVMNIPSAALAPRIWALLRHHGKRRIQESGFTLTPARTVKSPLLMECSAHLECKLVDTKNFGDEVLIFGKIRAFAIDAACESDSQAEQYFALRPIFFLEDQTYGTIDWAAKVDADSPTEMLFFIVEIEESLEPAAAMGEARSQEISFLRMLRDRGILLVAGGYEQEVERAASRATMFVIQASDVGQAHDCARKHPGVLRGKTYRLRPWRRWF